MPGSVNKHFPLLANGDELAVVASKRGIKIPNIGKILFVKAALQSVDTAIEAAASLSVTEVIAADGKSFDLYVWDAAGAAGATAVDLKWFAIVE